MKSLTEIQLICELSGVQYVGIQKAASEEKNLVLFNDPQTNGTLALPATEFSETMINAHVRRHREIMKFTHAG